MKFGLEEELIMWIMKTSITQIWMVCHLLPFAKVGQNTSDDNWNVANLLHSDAFLFLIKGQVNYWYFTSKISRRSLFPVARIKVYPYLMWSLGSYKALYQSNRCRKRTRPPLSPCASPRQKTKMCPLEILPLQNSVFRRACMHAYEKY